MRCFLARQDKERVGIYTDYTDVLSAAKVHQLLKFDIIPKGDGSASCHLCSIEPHSEDLEILSDISIYCTQTLLDTKNIFTEKIIYIADFLSHKHFEENTDFDDSDNEVPSDFIEKLSRGGLRVPTLNLVFLVHSAIELYDKMSESRKSCTKYFRSLLSFIVSYSFFEIDLRK